MIRIWMLKKDSDGSRHARLLILVDESNVGSSVRTAGRGLDWLKLREFLAGPNTGRDLIEMVDSSFASVHQPQLRRRPTSGHS
jgi:hypothetical protein